MKLKFKNLEEFMKSRLDKKEKKNRRNKMFLKLQYGLSLTSDLLEKTKEEIIQKKEIFSEFTDDFLHTTYSDIDKIPSGYATDDLIDGCLVIEGGAFRGLYTQGVLDAMMKHNLNFKTVIGVSAGALSAVSYISGQIGRSARANLRFRYNSSYIGIKAYKLSHSMLNIDFLLDDLNDFEALDEDRYNNKNRRFIAVATDCNTGEALFLEKSSCSDMKSAIKASASMPFLSPMVNVEGKLCLDGGCSCPIPYKWALNNNFKNIVVIKTRDKSYRTKERRFSSMAESFYSDYPLLAKKLVSNATDYNNQLNELDLLENKGRVFLIEPSERVKVNRLEMSLDKLADLYFLGYKDLEDSIHSLETYLNRKVK